MSFSGKHCIKNAAKWQKIYNQKYLILQNRFEVDNSYAFPKGIVHEGQRSCKFDYLYSSFVHSISNHAVYCTGCVMFLSEETKILQFFCQQEIKGLP